MAHAWFDFALERSNWQLEDYALEGYAGLQVWNTIDNDKDRDAGIEIWKGLMRTGRRIFISGGSDAHGDFSYMTTVKGDSDNAFGKVRTYVYTKTFDNDGILNALENGHSIITDGPLLIFNITNEHGETAIIGNEIAGRDLTLNIQWESTSEFGKLDHIYIHRGIIDETEEEITEYHLTPDNLSGTQVYSNLSKKIPISKTAYIRLNASTDKNSTVYTNPIWINEEETDFTPLDLCMVLDRSGSMKEPMGDIKKIEGVKKAANDVIDVLLPNERISLISFSNTATTDIDFTSNFNEAKMKIGQLNANGGTSFGAGLEKALDQFDTYGNPERIPTILFMSDGIHNTLPDPDAFVEYKRLTKIMD